MGKDLGLGDFAVDEGGGGERLVREAEGEWGEDLGVFVEIDLVEGRGAFIDGGHDGVVRVVGRLGFDDEVGVTWEGFAVDICLDLGGEGERGVGGGGVEEGVIWG